MTVYVYAWGNNDRRAELKGRRCVIEARGKMRTVLIRFLDTGERVTTSAWALREAPAPRRSFPLCTRDDLCEMLLDHERLLDRLDSAVSVSREAEARRLESRARAVQWLGMVRDDLRETEGAKA